ncbi:maleate cis-trans isomerase family protein [Streptomyces radiopugnans]|uniref:maleate cis-trans isomerase family protein n=1 Tax=Streptomyces radiopugnans TaxID=403935 RepID=UPI003F1ACE9F
MRRHSWVAQLGVLVIHNDPVVEAELWAMAPDGVTVHAARFESPTSGGAEYTGTPWKEMVESPDVRRGLGQLGRMDLSAICLCFGSASFFGGPEFDEGFTAAARELAGGTEVYTAGQAIVGALAATGVERPLVVVPPWFTAPTFAAARGYLEAAGRGAADLLQYQLDEEWREVRRHQLFDRGGRWEVRPDEVCRQVAGRFPEDADGVLIPGSGFRSFEAVEPLEDELGVPVVTSNQACLWKLLDLTGLDAAVPGGGRLLGRRPAAAV